MQKISRIKRKVYGIIDSSKFMEPSHVHHAYRYAPSYTHSITAAIMAEVELPLCPVRYVVVYSDRAEVTREISLTDIGAGENEVTLKNISKAIDK